MRTAHCVVALALMSLLAAVPDPAVAEVVDSTEDGFTIENRQTVPVESTAAWQALVADIDRWWPKDHSWWGAASRLSIDPRAGGCFCEIADDGRQALHMTVTFVDPGKTLRLLGGLGPLQGMGLHGAMEFRLEPAPEGAGTVIALRYRVGGYGPEDLRTLAPVVDRVQSAQLGGLAEYLRSAVAGQRNGSRGNGE